MEKEDAAVQYIIKCSYEHLIKNSGCLCESCGNLTCQEHATGVSKKCPVCGSTTIPFSLRIELFNGKQVDWIKPKSLMEFGLYNFNKIPEEAMTMSRQLRESSSSGKIPIILFKTAIELIDFIYKGLELDYRRSESADSVRKRRYVKVQLENRPFLLLNHDAKGEKLATILTEDDSQLVENNSNKMLFLHHELKEYAGGALLSLGQYYGFDISNDKTLLKDFTDNVAKRIMSSISFYKYLKFILNDKKIPAIRNLLEGRVELVQDSALEYPYYNDLLDATDFLLAFFDLELTCHCIQNYEHLYAILKKDVKLLKVKISTSRNETKSLIEATYHFTQAINKVDNCSTTLELVQLMLHTLTLSLQSCEPSFFWSTAIKSMAENALEGFEEGNPFKRLYFLLSCVFKYVKLDSHTKFFIGKFLVIQIIENLKKFPTEGLVVFGINVIENLIKILESDNPFFGDYVSFISEGISYSNGKDTIRVYLADLIGELVTLSTLAHVNNYRKQRDKCLKIAEGISERNRIQFMRTMLLWKKYEFTLNYDYLEDMEKWKEFLDEFEEIYYFGLDRFLISLSELITKTSAPSFNDSYYLKVLYGILVPVEKLKLPQYESRLFFADLQLWSSTYDIFYMFFYLVKAEKSKSIDDFRRYITRSYAHGINVRENSHSNDPINPLIDRTATLYYYTINITNKNNIKNAQDMLVEKNHSKDDFFDFITKLISIDNDTLDGYLNLIDLKHDMRDPHQRAAITLKKIIFNNGAASFLINSKAIIFVEGPTDVAVFQKFFRRLLPNIKIYFQPTKGLNNMVYARIASDMSKLGKKVFFIWDGDVNARPRQEKIKRNMEQEFTLENQIYFRLPKNTIENYLICTRAIYRAFPKLKKMKIDLQQFFLIHEMNVDKKKVFEELFLQAGIGHYTPGKAMEIASKMSVDEIDPDIIQISTEIRLELVGGASINER